MFEKYLWKSDILSKDAGRWLLLNRMHFFPIPSFAKDEGREGPIFNLQHTIAIASLFSVFICSETLLNCRLICHWKKRLNIHASKMLVNQSSRNWVHWYWDGLLYFCLLSFLWEIFIIDFLKSWFLSHIDAHFIQ